MIRKEKCGNCYFWEPPENLGFVKGDCCRYPQKIPKSSDEYCGEFKSKKGIEYLWEEKKNETDP